MLVSRTHRLGPELGVHLVHSRVEPAERTDVLLVIPRDLFGLAPLRRREGATGERVSGARSGDDLFALERRTRLKGRRARDRPNARPGEGVQGAREAREKSSRDHHARSCWIPARSVSHAPLALLCEKCAAASRACSPSFPVKGKKLPIIYPAFVARVTSERSTVNLVRLCQSGYWVGLERVRNQSKRT